METTKLQKHVIEQLGCGSCHMATAVGNITDPDRLSLGYLNARSEVHPATVDALIRKGLIIIDRQRECGRIYRRGKLTRDGRLVFDALPCVA